jgi:hypothetical protein
MNNNFVTVTTTGMVKSSPNYLDLISNKTVSIGQYQIVVEEYNDGTNVYPYAAFEGPKGLKTGASTDFLKLVDKVERLAKANPAGSVVSALDTTVDAVKDFASVLESLGRFGVAAAAIGVDAGARMLLKNSGVTIEPAQFDFDQPKTKRVRTVTPIEHAFINDKSIPGLNLAGEDALHHPTMATIMRVEVNGLERFLVINDKPGTQKEINRYIKVEDAFDRVEEFLGGAPMKEVVQDLGRKAAEVTGVMAASLAARLIKAANKR